MEVSIHHAGLKLSRPCSHHHSLESTMRKRCLTAFFVVLTLFGSACRQEKPRAVVYAALDPEFSEPLLQAFEAETGISAATRFDTESSKTIGLVNAIRAEAAHPRCDLFWNNEIVNTLRLQKEGLLQPIQSANGAAYPAQFRDPEGCWYGFAARARVLLVNTNLVAESASPAGIRDLADGRWRGRTAIAKPLFGSTATHMAVLYSLWGKVRFQQFLEQLSANEIQIQSGNRQVARAVAEGIAAFGVTDTDDAMEEIAAGAPVRIVYPDSKADQDGVLFIPNTLAVMRNCPHPEQAAALLDYLLDPANEAKLSDGPSAQIPLHPHTTAKARVATPAEVHAMSPDWQQAADNFQDAARLVEAVLIK